MFSKMQTLAKDFLNRGWLNIHTSCNLVDGDFCNLGLLKHHHHGDSRDRLWLLPFHSVKQGQIVSCLFAGHENIYWHFQLATGSLSHL